VSIKLAVEIGSEHMAALQAIMDGFTNKTLSEAVEFAIEKCADHEENWLGHFEGAGDDRKFVSKLKE